MPFSKALVLGSAALSLACAGSARQKVGTSTVQVVDAIGALHQRQNVHIRRISEALDAKVTPGANDPFVKSLKELVAKINSEVEPKIKDYQSKTQRQIDRSIEAIRAANKAVTQGKKAADEADGAWFECVEEKQKLKLVAEEKHQMVIDARLIEEEACQLRDRNKGFSWAAGDKYNLAFQCDNGIEGHCDQKLEAYKKGIMQRMQSDANVAMEKHQARYSELHKACLAKIEDTTNAHAVNTSAHADWRKQGEVCQGLRETRGQSVCEYGKKAQVKCVKEGAHMELIEAATTKGNEHSELDRMDEWLSARTAKCMVEKNIESGLEDSVDSSDLEACESQVNFGKQVGMLKLREGEFGDLATSNPCANGPISFHNGLTWEFPDGKDIKSTDYHRREWSPSISLNSGSKPFGFC